MLRHFPTPYPEELWYSVLCRFHVRSGNSCYAMTMRELFGVSTATMNVLLANENFLGILDKLPKGFLSGREILQHHTILPTVMRFSSQERIERFYRYFLSSDSELMRAVTVGMCQWERISHLRYCPVCAREELARYGELYWHAPHQIELITVCPRHGCMLENSSIKYSRTLVAQFKPALPSCCPDVEPRPAANELAYRLSEYMYELWKLPVEQNRSMLNNGLLLYRLKERGLATCGTNLMNIVEIKSQLRNYYGVELISRYFEENRFGHTLTRMVQSGEYSFAEHYAFLALFLDVSPSQLLSGKEEYDDAELGRGKYEKYRPALREMSLRGYKWSKVRVADRLGVESCQLDGIAQSLGIPVFWNKKSKDGEGRTGKGKPHLCVVRGDIDRELFDAVAKRIYRGGFSCMSEYIAYCVRQELAHPKYDDFAPDIGDKHDGYETCETMVKE